MGLAAVQRRVVSDTTRNLLGRFGSGVFARRVSRQPTGTQEIQSVSVAIKRQEAGTSVVVNGAASWGATSFRRDDVGGYGVFDRCTKVDHFEGMSYRYNLTIDPRDIIEGEGPIFGPQKAGSDASFCLPLEALVNNERRMILTALLDGIKFVKGQRGRDVFVSERRGKVFCEKEAAILTRGEDLIGHLLHTPSQEGMIVGDLLSRKSTRAHLLRSEHVAISTSLDDPTRIAELYDAIEALERDLAALRKD